MSENEESRPVAHPSGASQNWRLVLVPVCMFGVIAALLLAGRAGWLGEFGEIANLAENLNRGPLGLLLLAALFCFGAFLGVPQFALIGAAIVAFGPMLGFAYAWAATLCSGTLTFWTGRWLGADAVRRWSGKRLEQLSGLLNENAFTASAIVRTIPTGPFIFVNMAFGASGARFVPFLLGLAGGSLPKLALIAFAGDSLIAAVSGSVWRAIGIGGVTVAIWLIIGFVSKRTLSRDG